MHDRQILVRRVADELAISKTLLYEIISDYLGMKKVCTRWVPKLQRANRVDCGEELLKNCNQDSTGFFDRIVTEDEIWIHQHESHDRLARSSSPSSEIVKMFFSSMFYHLLLQSMVHITHHPFTGYVFLVGRNVARNLFVVC